MTPLLAEGEIGFPFMAMKIAIAGANTDGLAWLAYHGDPNFNYDTSNSGSYAVLIDDWDEVDDPAVVLRKTNTLTDFPLPLIDYGDSNITEYTVIEIRKD